MSHNHQVLVVKEHFGIQHDLKHMCPIVVGAGYTRDYIDGKITEEQQIAKLKDAFSELEKDSDTLIIEGTGHSGVGSIIGLNNAQAASHLGADCVLVANGGLGSAFDELELQRVMMKEHGVKVRGVILNGVRPAKRDMVKEYFTQLLAKSWGAEVPLLGVVPDHSFLGQPTLEDLEDFFGGHLMTGHRDRKGHYPLERAHLVVTDLRRFMTLLEQDHQTRTLYITHCSRDDIILGFLTHCQRMKRSNPSGSFEAALLLCGHHTEDLYGAIQDVAGATDFPVMHVPLTTHAALLALRAFVPKLNLRDRVRCEAVVNHYEPFIDFDKLLGETTTPQPSA